MEDFVPYELAKKLKEKGFREECLAYYTSEHTLYNNTICLTEDKYLCLSDIDYEEFLKSNNEETRWENICDAPTISQVLKWLREEHQIHIFVDITSVGWYPKVSIKVKLDETRYWFSKALFESDFFDTYEEAALAGIKYVINNNLI